MTTKTEMEYAVAQCCETRDEGSQVTDAAKKKTVKHDPKQNTQLVATDVESTPTDIDDTHPMVHPSPDQSKPPSLLDEPIAPNTTWA